MLKEWDYLLCLVLPGLSWNTLVCVPQSVFDVASHSDAQICSCQSSNKPIRGNDILPLLRAHSATLAHRVVSFVIGNYGTAHLPGTTQRSKSSRSTETRVRYCCHYKSERTESCIIYMTNLVSQGRQNKNLSKSPDEQGFAITSKSHDLFI